MFHMQQFGTKGTCLVYTWLHVRESFCGREKHNVLVFIDKLLNHFHLPVAYNTIGYLIGCKIHEAYT